MLKSKSRYYYKQLDDSGKHVYNVILSAWEARNPNPSFTMNTQNAQADINKILKYIDKMSPFWAGLKPAPTFCLGRKP
jgi:hypothetical protein